MDIKLYPRPVPATVHIPPGDRLHIWIGVFGVTTAPQIKWLINGTPTAPTAVVTLKSVRKAGVVTAATPRAFTGIYEFSGLRPNTGYTITAQSGSEEASIEARTLPNQLSIESNEPFHVLLVSCYYQPEDRNELVSTVVRGLKGIVRPHLTLLLGDQVYLDLPTLTNFKDDVAWLAEKFESYYSRNWQGPGGLEAILSSAPCINIPDDHEYWNNAPHSSAIVGNTYSKGGRDRWREAAEMLYEGFQLPVPLKLGEPFVLDIPPLSFFLADSRSKRLEDRSQSMTTKSKGELKAWCNRVSQQGLFGIFATGQSLYDEPVGKLKGWLMDYSFSNYDDYPGIVTMLTSIPNRKRPILCLTGDVHWGRVTKSIDVNSAAGALFEVISSPSALVAFPGKDQGRKLGAILGGLFGKKDPWPRHDEPKEPPDYLAMRVLKKQYHSREWQGQIGDHVTLLSFSRAGSGVDVLVTYYPIHDDAQVRQPIVRGPLQLRPL